MNMVSQWYFLVENPQVAIVIYSVTLTVQQYDLIFVLS